MIEQGRYGGLMRAVRYGRFRRKVRRTVRFLGIGILAVLLQPALSMTVGSTKVAGILAAEVSAVENAPSLEERWGLRPVTMRITGADHFLDFRYRVTDPEKAAVLMGGRNKAFLIHQPTGKVFSVAVTKLGPLRAKTVKPKAGRQYVILFQNSSGIVSKGDRVTVVIGEFRAENLIVE